jgi:hypothetical protein
MDFNWDTTYSEEVLKFLVFNHGGFLGRKYQNTEYKIYFDWVLLKAPQALKKRVIEKKTVELFLIYRRTDLFRSRCESIMEIVENIENKNECRFSNLTKIKLI